MCIRDRRNSLRSHGESFGTRRLTSRGGGGFFGAPAVAISRKGSHKMHRRAGFASSGLFAALLALVLAALSPVALATGSASPSPAAAAAAPKGVPIVLGVIPDPTGQRTQWFWYIAAGSIITVELTVISIALACLFALFGSLGRLSKKMTFKQAWDRYQSREYMFRMVIGRIPYWLATFYTSLFRGTPLLLQIFVIYQGAPEVIKAFGLPESYNPPAFWSGVAALSLNYGAYLTEVFRAGIQAVPKGQNEAAWAIGLSGWQTQRRIVLPQAFKIVIPAVGNDFIALIKDTSLVSVITVEEPV